MFTASYFPILKACPAAGALPRCKRTTEAAEAGTALHLFLQRANEVGLDAAMEELPEGETRDLALGLNLKALPIEPGTYVPEVAFAYNPEDDTGREIGRGLDRKYGYVEVAEIPGTADVAALGRGFGLVMDYKSGSQDNVTPVRQNLQMKILALGLSRAWGRDTVRAALVFTQGGRASYDEVEWGPMALAEAREEVREVIYRVENQREVAGSGVTVDAHIGPWCRYCQSLPYCPAQLAVVRAAAADPEALQERMVGLVLDADNAAKGYHLVTGLEAFLGLLKQSIYTFAAQTPVDLGDGRVLREVETKRESLDGKVAFEVVQKLHGPLAAAEACEMKTSKEAIKRALGPLVARGKLSGAMEETLEAIRQAHGSRVALTKSVRPVKAGGKADE